MDGHTEAQTERSAGFQVRPWAIWLISLFVIVGVASPALVRAGVLGDFFASIRESFLKGRTATASSTNLQTLSLLRPAMNVDPSAGRGGGDVIIVDNSALLPDEGPSGTIADIERPKNSTISVYVVRPGDTLVGIAKMYGVSPNTILWANDLPRASILKVGQTLTILPVTGVKYTVKKGDTLSSIAKGYGGDADEIASFNGLESGSSLVVGTALIIPDGEAPVVVATAVPKRPATSGSSAGIPIQAGYYLRPIAGGIRSQGIHGYNGIDLAASSGTPIFASAEGEVIVAKGSGWNGGYGQYVVIQHPNGSQTLYAHASSIIVSIGQRVQRGQVIAYVGATGKATGAHVHFEIRNGTRNPF